MVLRLFVITSILFGHTFAQKKTTNTAVIDSSKIMTIRGRVEKGAEAGCLVLINKKDKKSYLLLNTSKEISIGDCISAKGYVTNQATTCMQGIPFSIISYCPCGSKSKPKYKSTEPK